MISPDDLVDDYAASLIEPDEDRRLQILRRVWADDCEVVLPERRLQGRDQINAHITTIRQAYGQGTSTPVGPIDAHNGFLRFEWQTVDSSGEIISTGVNVAQQGPDGRLVRVVLFRGLRPGDRVHDTRDD